VQRTGTYRHSQDIGVDLNLRYWLTTGVRLVAFGSECRQQWRPANFTIPVSGEREMSDQTYDDGRARNLEALLRALALRIQELDDRDELLRHAGELTRLIGDIRSELFHYEVRVTYDTPEIAENRRIVKDAKGEDEPKWEKREWRPDEDDREW
jgi:hypothetical protein